MAEELDDRARDVLRAVVQEFITSGDPVGSQQLTRRGEFEVSPATMRNVLSELEALGYLEKPHTSAGRIPTNQGYRFFVDSLLQLKSPSPADQQLIEAGLANVGSGGVEERLQEAGKVLHQLSRHAGVVLIPRPSAGSLQRIEFVRLGDDRALAILVGQGGQVQNKLVMLDRPVSAEELIHASNYLNELLRSAASIEDVRSRILQELETQRTQYDEVVARALKLGAAATDVSSAERVVIEGTGSFLESPEFAEDVRRMRALFKALDDKHKLLSLLDRVQRAREMQIFIGAESEFGSQGDVTVIASPYGTDDQVLGTVGVIGPTRLDYQRVIPLVNFTARVLSRVLKSE
ncbi:MAG: heat-inducible transcriptional repressor HrcA [Archangium sp.]|nr:heat-inducible transcriptional repressor HrcA [Archangium sp.]MDP3152242.1 heat-inducible transcriptional repressor HrcA [Archangium sp.]MDP3571087.1 heat-inducible transcriptional repressor HrcA [Archangium sp.]